MISTTCMKYHVTDDENNDIFDQSSSFFQQLVYDRDFQFSSIFGYQVEPSPKKHIQTIFKPVMTIQCFYLVV